MIYTPTITIIETKYTYYFKLFTLRILFKFFGHKSIKHKSYVLKVAVNKRVNCASNDIPPIRIYLIIYKTL